MTAAELRALRKRLGMTQAQLAEALKLDVSSISNYEGARGPYPIPRVVELACKGLLPAMADDGTPVADILDHNHELAAEIAALKHRIRSIAGLCVSRGFTAAARRNAILEIARAPR